MKLATLCYIKKDGKTLMLHRIKKKNDMHEGKWNGLGGKFEPGETPEDCVIREIEEESGLNIIKPRLRGLLTFPEFGGKVLERARNPESAETERTNSFKILFLACISCA